MSRCKDYSFGLTERDIQVSNAKVNQVLSACTEVAQDEVVPMWFSSANLSFNAQLYNPVPPNTVPLVFAGATVAQPSTFVADSNGVFTIPSSGLWRISTNIAVTEFSGNPQGVLLFLSVNEHIPNPPSVFEVVGYGTADSNQTVWIPGEVCVPLNQGDTVQVLGIELVGASTDLQAIAKVVSGSNTFNISRICLQKMS